MSQAYEIDLGLLRYIADHLKPEPPLLTELRQLTADMPEARMQIGREQGAFMALLVRLLAARRCLEIGVFTGYSSLAVALALPEDGLLVACDVNAEWTDVARGFWQRAGVEDKIDLRLAPAHETLADLLAQGEGESYDFAFIDADKQSYDEYYEKSLKLLRPGGLVLVDNCFWDGAVLDPERDDADTSAIRSLNRKIAADPRVDSFLAPIGDGLHLARKR